MVDVRDVELGPVAETMLIPLYARAVMSRQEPRLITDPQANDIVDAIDWDFSRFDGAPSLLGSVLRTRMLDLWIERWLVDNPHGTVVEVGAGLNTRAERLDNGTAHWIDVDLPDAMALRRQFFTDTARHRQVAASATDDDWVRVAAASPEPWFVVAEAVLCFLTEADVHRALSHIATGLRDARVAFDTWGLWMRDHQDDHDALKVMDARVQWFCDDPAHIDRMVPGLELRESTRLSDCPATLVDMLSDDARQTFIATKQDPQTNSYRLNLFTITEQPLNRERHHRRR